MKYIKFALMFALVAFCAGCPSSGAQTTYYFVVSSGCSYWGAIAYTTPNGAGEYYDIPLTYFATKNFKFESGQHIQVSASLYNESIIYCLTSNITVTIMKGEGVEGTQGSGGTVWKTATGTTPVTAEGYAD